MSIGPGEYIDPQTKLLQYMPLDELGHPVPQPQYVVMREETAEYVQHPALLSMPNFEWSLLPFSFDDLTGSSHITGAYCGSYKIVDFADLPGMTHLGALPVTDGRLLPTFSFRYSDGAEETMERVVAAEAFGNGVLHPDHEGREPSVYIIGRDIGRRNPATGEIEYEPQPKVVIKHFAMNCIVQDEANT